MSKQKLIIIAGSPCVGKTTVTQKLFTSYVCVHPDTDLEIIIPHRENIEQLLKWL